mgnify:CR=1 FL=1
MEKFVPYEKLSRKKKRELDRLRRGTWGSVNPVTRKPQNSKAYNRRQAQKWKYDSNSVPVLFYSFNAFANSVGFRKIW